MESPNFKLRKIRPSGKKEAVSINNIFLSEGIPATIGRVVSDDVHISLHSKSTPLMISRKHATLSVVNNHVFVVDHDVSFIIKMMWICTVFHS